MTEYICLNKYEIQSLNENRPVFIWVDGECYVLCTDEYFEKQRNESQESEEN